MPDLPRLPLADLCTDQDCKVPVGAEHRPDCTVAICVSTGHQRLLHLEGPRRPLTDLGGLVDAHVCGADIWTGYPRGTVEAAAAGLFVVRDQSTGRWTPCPDSADGAVPDLTRVIQAGTWNPIRQCWLVPAEATSHA
jgi:hypothetical protein